MTDENTSKCERILYYDILNILACIAVISLHHNGIVHTYSNTLRWKLALVVEVMAYWAVPVFLMLSGATLMDYRKHYDTKTFLKKKSIENRNTISILEHSGTCMENMYKTVFD